MTDQSSAAPAAEQDPLTDEYVNAVIRQHGYDSPETVIARLWQWIGLNGSENGVTLLMYEAHKALSKLRAEGDERAAFEADYAKAWNAAYENKTSHTAEEVAELREGDGYGEENVYLNARWRGWKARTNLASAPVADEHETFETWRKRELPWTTAATPGISFAWDAWRTRAALASAPVADPAPEYAYSDDGRTVTMTNAARAPGYRASAPVAGEALGWRVRERRSNDGTLLDCFVEAPAAPGMAYAQEVLGDDYAEAQGGIEGKLKHCLMIVAWANAPVAGEARAIVYPPDGTESPFTVINLGSGAVQMGPCLHDGRIGGLWFGKDGKGMGHEQVLGRHAHPGETIAVVTFANVEGLDVMLGELLRCREQYFPDAKAAPQASEAVLPKTVQYSPDDSQERALWKDGWNDCVRHAEALKHQEKSDD